MHVLFEGFSIHSIFFGERVGGVCRDGEKEVVRAWVRGCARARRVCKREFCYSIRFAIVLSCERKRGEGGGRGKERGRGKPGKTMKMGVSNQIIKIVA